MKSKYLLFSLLFLIVGSMKAQTQFTNPGMETWEQRTVGSYSFSDPAGWYTLNELGQFGISNTTLKSTDAHTGSNAAHLVSLNSAFGTIPGLLTVNPIIDATGDPNLDLNFIPFTNRPNAIQFWYKSFPETDDLNAMYCLLTKWNASTQSRDTIAYANWEMDSTLSTYTLALVNFTYLSVQNPDSLSIIFASSIDGFDPIAGSEFFVDDVSLNYGTGIQESLQASLNIYPNPSASLLFIDCDNNIREVRAFDQVGRLYPVSLVARDKNVVDISHLADGIYTLEVDMADGKQFFHQTFVKQ